MARKITFLQRIGYLIEAAIVIPLGIFIKYLPRPIAFAIGRGLARLIFRIDKKNKYWAYENLKIIFGEGTMSKQEQDALIKKTYQFIVRGAIEFLKIGFITPKNYEKYAYYENYESYEKALKLGKGAIIVTAHMGNWEYFGSIPAKLGVDLGAVINRQFNPYTDDWLRRIREKQGKIKCFYNSIPDLAKISRHLKAGGTIAMLLDQTYYFKPIFVPFFGRTAATADGPAKLHLKYGAPLIIAMSIMQPDGRYKMMFEEPKIFEKSGDPEADHKKIMTWINSRYEEYIRQYPEQWFSLLHPRWERTKAEDFEGLDVDPW